MKSSGFVDVLFGDYIDYELERDGIREILYNGQPLPELSEWLIHRAANDKSKPYYTNNDKEFIDFAKTIGIDVIHRWLNQQSSIHAYDRSQIITLLNQLLKPLC